MTNELDLLRRMRAEVPEPDDAELRAGEARLTAAIRAARRPPRVRALTWRRPAVLWPGLTTGLVAGLVATVLALGGGEAPRAPDADPPAVPVAVTRLLDQAARAAGQAPELNPRPDQFILYRSLTMFMSGTGGVAVKCFDRSCPPVAESRYLMRTDRKLWATADGAHDGAVWWRYLEPRAYPGWPIPESARREAGRERLLPLPVCAAAGAPAWSRRDYLYLKTLPTDAAGMLAALKVRTGEPAPTDLQVWRALADMLVESYLPPAQRAAVFRAAKLIAGTTVVERATDAADRAGVAVARVNEQTGVRTEIIFDAVTYRYLGEREFVVDAAKAGAPVGSQVSATAELSATVADTAPVPQFQKDSNGDLRPIHENCK